jgi:hypothetical protein
MKAPGFAPMILIALTGAAPAQFFLFQDPVTLDMLDGNYRTIASCTYQQLVRQHKDISRTDLPEEGIVRIGSRTIMDRWELSFVNEEKGRHTRLDWTAGAYPSEHVLSTARACAA